jgi:hypothetical protein
MKQQTHARNILCVSTTLNGFEWYDFGRAGVDTR